VVIPAEGVGGDGGRPNGGKDPEFSSGKDPGDESDGLREEGLDGDGGGMSDPQKQWRGKVSSIKIRICNDLRAVDQGIQNSTRC
jgi:hypothetical protein